MSVLPGLSGPAVIARVAERSRCVRAKASERASIPARSARVRALWVLISSTT